MSITIGIDHGYYAIKTAHCSFPAGLTSYGEHEPYTRQGLLEFGGCFFVCGSGRQPIQRDKTANDNYYLLTLAAIAKEIKQRGLPPECSVRIAAGLPLTSFGRDKPKFRDYLLRSKQPVNFRFEGVEYSITIEEVAIFPQGYAALMTEVGLLQDEPSMLLMDLGGWTVDLMRIDNAIPAADTAHSLELGMIRCVDDIREQVRRETGLSLTDAQIENMLAGQPCTVSDTVRDIVNKQGRKYTEHLLSATMEAGFDLHAIPAALLGGGASVVSRHLSPKDGLCKTIFLLDDISLVAFVSGSAYGIFFAANAPRSDTITVQQAVETLTAEYRDRLEEISDTVQHDRQDITANDDVYYIRWQDVLAVFSSYVAGSEQGAPVAALTEEQLDKLRETMWAMNAVDYSTRAETAVIETTDKNGKATTIEITETVLVIELTHKTPNEMAADYHFTTRQNTYLQLLQDPQYEELWAELLGGFAQGSGKLMSPDSTRTPTGTLQWPLPVAGTITSQFGHRVDPITGGVSSHTGTDIACAEGTPILAAADGMVTVANGLDSWGGSYGYYIQIDHGGGLETLYAHCSSICVTTGQQVQAGEVIGYVGHTGRAIGSHLHWETHINRNISDAMSFFVVL